MLVGQSLLNINYFQYILDLALCNFFGIVAGYFTLRFFNVELFDFLGVRPGFFKNVFNAIKTHDWSNVKWGFLANRRRFIIIAVFIIFVCFSFFFQFFQYELNDLTVFALKGLLWIPPSNFLVITRMFIMYAVMLPSMYNIYHWIIDKNYSFSTATIINILIFIFEWICIIRWRIYDYFIAETPKVVKYGWISFFVIVLIFVLVYFPIMFFILFYLIVLEITSERKIIK